MYFTLCGLQSTSSLRWYIAVQASQVRSAQGRYPGRQTRAETRRLKQVLYLAKDAIGRTVSQPTGCKRMVMRIKFHVVDRVGRYVAVN